MDVSPLLKQDSNPEERCAGDQKKNTHTERVKGSEREGNFSAGAGLGYFRAPPVRLPRVRNDFP